MTKNNAPTIRKPNEGRIIAVVGDVYRFITTSEDTNGKYAMWEAIVPPSGCLPPETLIEVGHVHRLADPEPLKAMLEECERMGDYPLELAAMLRKGQ